MLATIGAVVTPGRSPSRNAWMAMALGAGMALVACSESAGDDDNPGTGADASVARPDADVGERPDAAAGQADARVGDSADAATGTPTEVTLSQSTSQEIVAANSIGCFEENGTWHLENRFFRIFNLSSFGIDNAFTVKALEIGIESATAGPDSGGTQPADVRLYTLAGAPSLTNLTEIASLGIRVPDQVGTRQRVDIEGVAPGGSTLVVEFHTPNAAETTDQMLIGSNSAGESGPTYVVSSDCGIDELSTMASLGFDQVHWVLNVIGTHRQ